MTIRQAVAIPILSVVLLCILITSCEKDSENAPVGEDWMDLDTQVYYIDTLTVNATTFKFDSIAVSGTDRLLIGAYTDPVFGFTKSKSYAQFTNSIYTLDSDAVFDSIALILNYDNYFYNDTIPVQKINVYEIIKDVEPDDDADSYYNTTRITVNTTPIASKSFIAKPKKDDSLHVTLNNIFGKTLFENLRDNKINNSDEFLKAYQGILIEPDNNNTAILGFLKSSFIRIYYTDKDELETEVSTFDMLFNTTNSFHNVSNTVEGTVFETLTSQEIYLPSSITNNTSFMQAGTGIATRIDIPNLESLYDISGTGIIIDAYLKISLKQNSSTKNLHTNDSLNVYIIDKKSNIVSALTDTQGNTVLGLIDQEDTEFNITTYSIPVKYFLNLKLTDINGDDLFLAIYPKDYNKSVNRYILNGEGASNNIKSKLELIYAIYDK
ncbi:DUF4270 family protein [Mariniflexile litorale]|uniref:DUF4270 family protein n=1 Tax=Mariniflexile litorale TaxID=3045158 RepID=A0AAU7EFQ0_9FLAO|nr:DUF4270 family protein [Mariniflexile sp. KMM 9835]MDQ8211706.1 DUF4270 family protein [Mariniflexile sp. KMM 9835]